MVSEKKFYTKRDNRADVLQELNSASFSHASKSYSLIEKLRGLVPFDDYSFAGIDLEGCGIGQGIHLASSYPKEFLDIFHRNQYAKIDPLVTALTPDTPIAQWENVEHSLLSDPKTKQLQEDLNYYHILPRTAIGCFKNDHLYGGIAFSRKISFSEEELSTLQIYGSYIHAQLSQTLISTVNHRLGITLGEKNCLILASQGYTSEEIALYTKYTVETVNTYLKLVTKKLGATNRAHAIAEAIRRKFIL